MGGSIVWHTGWLGPLRQPAPARGGGFWLCGFRPLRGCAIVLRRIWLGRLPQAPRGGLLQDLGHQVEGAVLGPGGAVAGLLVGFGLVTDRLGALQQPQRAAGLAGQAGGQSEAFLLAERVCLGLFGAVVAGQGVLGGGDVEGGKLGLSEVGGEEGGDHGDGGLVSEREGLGSVVWRVGEGAAEVVDELVVGVVGELGAEGLDWGHGGKYS